MQILHAKYENPSIKDYPIEYFTKSYNPNSEDQGEGIFRKRIFVWYALAGVREPLDQLNFTLLVQYLLDECAGLTLEEIELALTMNLKHELGGNRIAAFYNVLDVDFISKIVFAYWAEREKAERKYHEASQAAPAKQIDAPNPSEYEIAVSWANIIVEDIVLMKKGDFLPVGMVTKFNFLEKLGILNLSDQEYLTGSLRAIESLRFRAATADEKTERNKLQHLLYDQLSIFDQESADTLLETETKSKLVLNWYRSIIEFEIDLVPVFFEALSKQFPERITIAKGINDGV